MNYDGLTDIGDFSLLASHFNAGTDDIGSSNPPLSGDDPPTIAGRSGTLPDPTVLDLTATRGTSDVLPALAQLYVALLDYPNVYWEARLRPDIWWRFEAFESMNLGAIPAMPTYLSARSVPEPGPTAFVLVAVLTGRNLRLGIPRRAVPQQSPLGGTDYAKSRYSRHAAMLARASGSPFGKLRPRK